MAVPRTWTGTCQRLRTICRGGASAVIPTNRTGHGSGGTGTTYTKNHPYREDNPKGNHLYDNMYPKNRILQSVSTIQPYQPPLQLPPSQREHRKQLTNGSALTALPSGISSSWCSCAIAIVAVAVSMALTRRPRFVDIAIAFGKSVVARGRGVF